MAKIQSFYGGRGVKAPLHQAAWRHSCTIAGPVPAPQRCRAVKKSLGEVEVRSLGSGRYLLPVLEPARDGLPFAMALELHERRGEAEGDCPSTLWGQAEAEEGLYALRYLLDCEPQAAQAQGGMPLRPGDSVLAPHTRDSWQLNTPQTPSFTDQPPDWKLASVTLLLPRDVRHGISGGDTLDAGPAARSADQWQAAPIVGRLPADAVSSLMSAARDRTRAAFPPREHEPSASASSPSTPPFQGPQDARSLRGDPGVLSHTPSTTHDDRSLTGGAGVRSHAPATSTHGQSLAPASSPAHAPGDAASTSTIQGDFTGGAMLPIPLGTSLDADSGPARHVSSSGQVPSPGRQFAVHGPDGEGRPFPILSHQHAAGTWPAHVGATGGAPGSLEGRALPAVAGVGLDAPEVNPGESASGGGKGGGIDWSPFAQLSAAGELILAEGLSGALAYILPSIAVRIARRLRRMAPRTGPLRRGLQDLNAFQLPNQTNRLALVFDPLSDDVPFTFGVEIFLPGHKTTPHTHPTAHELFFILAGRGEAFCDGVRFPVSPGDVVVFPPTSVHGIDTSPSHGKMYCLEMMTTNDMFAEMVRSGTDVGTLPEEDLCVLAAVGCS